MLSALGTLVHLASQESHRLVTLPWFNRWENKLGVEWLIQAPTAVSGRAGIDTQSILNRERGLTYLWNFWLVNMMLKM